MPSFLTVQMAIPFNELPCLPSSDEDLGHMDLVVKVYFRDVHPKFPEGGNYFLVIAIQKIMALFMPCPSMDPK